MSRGKSAAVGCWLREIIASRSNENFTLDAANRLSVTSGFPLLEEFLSKSRDYFEAEAESVDFSDEAAARSAINTWVESKTNEKIKDLIPRGVLNGLTRLVLVNAVYFKVTFNIT